MYILVTDNKEKESLLQTFSSLVNKTCLEHFLQRNGYGDDFIRILFKDNLDEYEDQEEVREIGTNRVVLFAEYPAVAKDEKMYLTFKELYNYVSEAALKNYGSDSNVEELLLKLKEEFCIWNIER